MAGDARAVVSAVRLITPTVSLGSVDTLIQHPASLTHRILAAADRQASGISDRLLRMSVGLEDVEDLWTDLDQALTTHPGGGAPVTTAPNTAGPGRGLIAALHVDGPTGEHADKLMLFGRFVGSWNVQWIGGNPPATADGELHFGWVLGGRAVQDIWIVPGRGQPGHSEPPQAFHGSTIRFYDPSIDAWRSTWIEPINGRVRRFIGRPDGKGIALLSAEDDPQLSWRFTDIKADSFTWQAETSRDGGASWHLDEQMLVTRADHA